MNPFRAPSRTGGDPLRRRIVGAPPDRHPPAVRETTDQIAWIKRQGSQRLRLHVRDRRRPAPDPADPNLAFKVTSAAGTTPSASIPSGTTVASASPTRRAQM